MGIVNYVLRHVNLYILLGMRKCCQRCEINLLIYPFIKRMVQSIVASIEKFQYYQLHTKYYPIFCAVRSPEVDGIIELSVWILISL